MIDLILISHGAFSAGAREAAEIIMGEQKNLTVLGLYPGETTEIFAAKLEQAIDAFDSPENVLILSDLNSGTPSNTALMMVLKKGVTSISGFNLPMLLEILSVRDEIGVKEAVEIACNTGKKEIINSIQILAEKR
ncbi:MAG: PTS mannose transporter subunit IIC [Bacillota bacterium]